MGNMNNMGNTGMNMNPANSMGGMGMGGGMGGGMGNNPGGVSGAGGMGMGGTMGGAGGSAMGDMGDMGRSSGGGYSTNTGSASVFGGGGAMGGRVDLSDNGGMSRGGGGASSSVPGNAGRAVGSSDSIIIRNLPVDCNWQVLREGFSHCGDIKYAEMKERGTGLIRFISERDAERAVCKLSPSCRSYEWDCTLNLFFFILKTTILF